VLLSGCVQLPPSPTGLILRGADLYETLRHPVWFSLIVSAFSFTTRPFLSSNNCEFPTNDLSCYALCAPRFGFFLALVVVSLLVVHLGRMGIHFDDSQSNEMERGTLEMLLHTGYPEAAWQRLKL